MHVQETSTFCGQLKIIRQYLQGETSSLCFKIDNCIKLRYKLLLYSIILLKLHQTYSMKTDSFPAKHEMTLVKEIVLLSKITSDRHFSARIQFLILWTFQLSISMFRQSLITIHSFLIIVCQSRYHHSSLVD